MTCCDLHRWWKTELLCFNAPPLSDCAVGNLLIWYQRKPQLTGGNTGSLSIIQRFVGVCAGWQQSCLGHIGRLQTEFGFIHQTGAAVSSVCDKWWMTEWLITRSPHRAKRRPCVTGIFAVVMNINVRMLFSDFSDRGSGGLGDSPVKHYWKKQNNHKRCVQQTKGCKTRPKKRYNTTKRHKKQLHKMTKRHKMITKGHKMSTQMCKTTAKRQQRATKRQQREPTWRHKDTNQPEQNTKLPQRPSTITRHNMFKTELWPKTCYKLQLLCFKAQSSLKGLFINLPECD